MSTPTLLTLPVELQTWIYYLAVVQDYDDKKPHGIQVEKAEDRNLASSMFSLLRTCRQIYQIAKPTYYNSNTFVFSDGYRLFRFRVLAFFTALGNDNIALCRNIRFDTPRLAGGLSGSYIRTLTIDFKFGTVASRSDDDAHGLITGKSFHQIAADLCKVLMLLHQRPRTRTWSARLAREIWDVLVTALEHELDEEAHGFFFPFGRLW